ncbi:MAG TPA: hypothetical protein VJV79_01405 [Polyangiaceae bacterium]|nr:hypothetical protein [Polyangiaceae bacterium]
MPVQAEVDNIDIAAQNGSALQKALLLRMIIEALYVGRSRIGCEGRKRKPVDRAADARNGFRKVRGMRYMPKLCAALKRHQGARSVNGERKVA